MFIWACRRRRHDDVELEWHHSGTTTCMKRQIPAQALPPFFSLLLLLLLLLILLCDVCRVHMRTASTASTSTAVTAILTRHQPSNSFPKSICPAWTKETARLRYASSSLYPSDLFKVDPSKVPCLANWKRDYNMETILIELRRYTCQLSALTAANQTLLSRYMALPQHKKLQQPKEGETF
jgi:hypothetical protein